MADDIVLITKGALEINDTSAMQGNRAEKFNVSRTKVLQSGGMPEANFWINSVEEVDSYVYLCQEVIMRHNLHPVNAR